jgi:hypothetical protein
LNLYAYVRNSPIIRVDADGHGFAMFDAKNASANDGNLPEDNTDELKMALQDLLLAQKAAQTQQQQQLQQQQQSPATAGVAIGGGAAAAAAASSAGESAQSHPGVEVLTFEPVGWIRSSFGHQAISIDGITYSFGETGTWWEGNTNDYLGKNTFRNGVGQVLNLTQSEAAGVLKAIKADEALGKQTFTPTNNCTTKVRQVLEVGTHRQFRFGGPGGFFAPGDFRQMLDFLGYVTQTNEYPKSK